MATGVQSTLIYGLHFTSKFYHQFLLAKGKKYGVPLTLIYKQHFAIAEWNLSNGRGQHTDVSKVSVLVQIMWWGPVHVSDFVRLNDFLLLSCNQSICFMPVVSSLQKLCCNLGLFPLAAQSPKRSAGTSPIEDWSLKPGACLHQTYTWASFLLLYSKWKQLLLWGMTEGLTKPKRLPEEKSIATQGELWSNWSSPLVHLNKFFLQISASQPNTRFLSDNILLFLIKKNQTVMRNVMGGFGIIQTFSPCILKG